MNRNSLWSLRLGFSNKQAPVIEKLGIQKFLEQSFQAPIDKKIPSLLDNSPKTMAELKEVRQKIKDGDQEAKRQILKEGIETNVELKSWWLDKMMSDEFPLREKMVCFWHNHYVATFQKVKNNYWIYQHNQILRENAFGNFRELTKQMVQSNAVVRYLDNNDNKKGKINENLSRELLELFTIGIGNYTEDDIQNGAKGLAGLSIGDKKATYYKPFMDNDTITYFGQKGIFKVDEMVDIIFQQKNAPYFVTRKILKWFIYDDPSEKLVTYYGDYFRSVDYEIKPLLTKIFTEEFEKNTAGSKIKNPLEYSVQLVSELNIDLKNNNYLAFFLKQQNMDLFNQPNVKGWDGGKSWLTSQIYLQRNNLAYLLTNGKVLNQRILKDYSKAENAKVKETTIKLEWKGADNKQIIGELTDRLLFQVESNTQKDLETVLKYDFDVQAKNADQAVLRLFNTIIKLPEFQLI
ncbi:DUF1800 domain-containing protein [Flavobacterium sp. UMI-01]|uniref:DUF1800 domain-containing protein n=1 Tax=Flavobacterium sp. UMI-01 TaxID=1441053 RepID=UPI001C7CA9A1|nr:DUF1800 domain-containing protein [Flavobacterium sp. UMI-01]GIZ08554.1 hypothetical protein FUMI01_12810 [Flavobacterium sp. UMI-01]